MIQELGHHLYPEIEHNTLVVKIGGKRIDEDLHKTHKVGMQIFLLSNFSYYAMF